MFYIRQSLPQHLEQLRILVVVVSGASNLAHLRVSHTPTERTNSHTERAEGRRTAGWLDADTDELHTAPRAAAMQECTIGTQPRVGDGAA